MSSITMTFQQLNTYIKDFTHYYWIGTYSLSIKDVAKITEGVPF